MGYRSTFSLSLLYIKSCLALFFYSKTLCAQNVIYKLKCIKFQTSIIQKASTSNNDKRIFKMDERTSANIWECRNIETRMKEKASFIIGRLWEFSNTNEKANDILEAKLSF